MNAGNIVHRINSNANTFWLYLNDRVVLTIPKSGGNMGYHRPIWPIRDYPA